MAAKGLQLQITRRASSAGCVTAEKRGVCKLGASFAPLHPNTPQTLHARLVPVVSAETVVYPKPQRQTAASLVTRVAAMKVDAVIRILSIAGAYNASWAEFVDLGVEGSGILWLSGFQGLMWIFNEFGV